MRTGAGPAVGLWPLVIAFGLGALLLQQFASLPSLAAGLLPVAVALLFMRWPAGRLALAFAVGFLWCLLFASQRLAERLPAGLEGRDQVIEGVVASIPQRSARRTRFVLDVERAPEWQAGGRIRLSWYRDAPRLQAGQRWRLKVRLKRPHGFANPGGFDYAGWLFRNRVAATGYVRRAPDNRLLDAAAATYPVVRWRQRLADRVMAGTSASGDGSTSSLLVALAVGDRGGIDEAQWQVLNATGTNHLLAISGLHIGLLAGIGFFLGRWLWALPGVTVTWLPAPMAGALGAVAAATLYALLAGMSLPTQRALVMVVVVMAAVCLRRRVVPARSLALALAAVLVLDPLAVRDPGFWLSFCAVGVLIYGMGWRPRQGGLWWRLGRAQWIIALGLLPLLLLLFQRLSLVAPLANMLAIPWVSIAVVPPLLAGTVAESVSAGGGSWLLALAAASLDWLWVVLAWMGALPLASWQLPGFPPWVLTAAMAGALLLLAPTGLPGRWLGLFGLLPMLLYQPPRPASGEAWVTQLDVGHGLAVVVRTRSHALLFDTGPAYGKGFDAGSSVIVPFLRDAGVRRIDTLLVSHGDSDHVGGLRSVRRGIEVGRVLSGVADRVPGAQACGIGQEWRWDGVHFAIVHPALTDEWRGNDGSCVLRVTSGAGAMLVTGDIEAAGEAVLVRRWGDALAADLMTAPHHGSRSSSTEPMLQAVGADTVLVPAGWRDRYGHPHPEVIARYREQRMQVFDSGQLGALGVRLPAAGDIAAPCAFRPGFGRYWHIPLAPAEGQEAPRPWSACRDGAG